MSGKWTPRIQSTTLLLIFLISLLPLGPSASAAGPGRTRDESLALLYAGRSILLEEVDFTEEGARLSGNLLAAPTADAGKDGDAALGNLIHATKQQRNQLQSSCQQLRASYQAKGRNCELQVFNDYCQSQEAKLNRRIGLLHKLRGDRRKAFTRLWHSVKRSGQNIWHAVGPVGRRILHRVGPEAAEVVLSGGTLGGGTLRRILIREAREVRKAKLNRLLERGLERFLHGQAALARAAGVADCTAEELEAAKKRLQDGETAGSPGEAERAKESEPTLDPGEFAGDDQDCQPGEPWLAAAWEDAILPGIQEDGKGCSSTAAYYTCLQEQEAAGVCPQDALVACEEIYEQILPSAGGQTVKITDHAVYHRDSDNYFEISFPLEGGPVSGYLAVDYVEDKGGGDKCSVSFTFTFEGTYNPSTCVLQGTGIKTLTWEESRQYICVGYPEPYDDRAENWSMVLRNGLLNISSPPYGFPTSGSYSIANNLR